MFRNTWVIVLAIGLLVATTKADVRLAGVFGNHMVLQQGAPVPVWGMADPAEKVTVSVAGQVVTTEAEADGHWRVNLKPLKAGGDAGQLSVAGKNTITISDVLIGEVWLASGQSNMQYSLKTDQDAATELPKANYPDIRYCMVGTRAEMKPMADRKLSWDAVTPETAKKLSAVAYYFGRDLHAALNVPIGIVESSVPGTVAQSWTNLEAFQTSPLLQHYVNDLQRATSSATRPSDFNAGAPTSLYNGMIAPLIPFAIKGVIWYQGESNAGQSTEYRTLFPAMIRGWRDQWGQGDFPFLFVQLPGFGKRGEPDKSNWAPMREAQTAALSLPNTGMAIALDLVPTRALLHPKSKVGVGHRLALIAQHQVYGQDVVDSGPTFASMKVEGAAIRVKFDHTAGGLVAGQATALKGFTIAGAERVFRPATAIIGDGGSVIVSSDQVQSPVAVRYGWADNPDVNLFNSVGLAAAPFRSDDWPIPPAAK